MLVSFSLVGSVMVVLIFIVGINLDVVQMQVQNKLQQVMVCLLQVVQNNGVIVIKVFIDILMVLLLILDDLCIISIDIGDFISSILIDQISCVEGVGDVIVFGINYVMCIWIDLVKLQKYVLMLFDVISVFEVQNIEVLVGEIGVLLV